jgi:hypothetical protein
MPIASGASMTVTRELRRPVEADEQDVDAEILGRPESSRHCGLRAEIPPHGVDGDSHARDPGQSSVPSVTCRPL